MSSVVPMRIPASFTTVSRHRSRRSRSSWNATTPCSDVRSMYPVIVAISWRAPALISSGSLVSRGNFSSNLSRAMPCASL
ncbi:hypothetical protein [Streptomyces sp. NBC_00259]|uniref:hypothetical protein n=1 Tax=Streptomyces sp. NBC_00259 TaxID=2903643 RepID=UPI003FA6A9CD